MRIATNKAGRDAMENAISAAEKVRRQLKAGRKPKQSKRLSFVEAFRRLAERADKGRELMRKYGLDPTDIHVAILYRADGAIGSSTLPQPGKTDPFFAKFEQLEAEYLGLLWWQTPADEHGSVPMWVEELNPNDKRAAVEMLIFRNALIEGKAAIN